MAFLDNPGLTHLVNKFLGLLSDKVDKVTGKGLSANDYTDTDKGRLDDLYARISGYAVTGGTTSAYTATVPGATLAEGTVILLRFNAANAASATLDVNGLGAKPIYYKGAAITASRAPANAVLALVYDATLVTTGAWHCVYSYDANTTYTNAGLGHGYGTCTTAAATAAKVVTLSSYALTTGGIVAVKFTYAVPAAATLNINSKGAKAIFYKGAAITADVIEAGDTVTFIYDGTQYHVLAIDRDANTVYVHPSYTSRSSGLYKITVDATGHVSAVTAVAKADITALGIPAQDTTYSTMTAATSSAAGAAGLVPAPAAGAQAKFLRGDGTWQTPTDTTYAAITTAEIDAMFE